MSTTAPSTALRTAATSRAGAVPPGDTSGVAAEVVAEDVPLPWPSSPASLAPTAPPTPPATRTRAVAAAAVRTHPRFGAAAVPVGAGSVGGREAGGGVV